MNNNTFTTFKKLPLDNAAKIYPAAMTKNWNAVYGVSAHIKSDVNVSALEKSVVQLAHRFPSFYVCLKKEFFWDCLVPATNFDVVERETTSPCRPFDVFNKEKPLFRVIYSNREIRVEFFHSVTDGTGAFEYLKALMVRYFENCKQHIANTGEIKVINENANSDELSDDFQKVYVNGLRCSRSESNAYQLDLKKEDNYLSRTNICVPIDRLKSVAKTKYGCTITQYVAAVYALAILQQYEKSDSKKPVKLAIPVNLRSFYQSTTLRNFSSYITINVTPSAEYSIENIIALIKAGMKEKITKENFTKSVSQNISDEKMIIAKYSPNSIKKFFMRQAFRIYGEKKYTSTVTSVGYQSLPQQLADKIDFMSATLGGTYLNRINCSVLGYENNLCICISSVSKDMDIQSFMNKYFISQGIPCKINDFFAVKKAIAV